MAGKTSSNAPDLKKLRQRFEEAKKGRQPYEKNWDKARLMYNGDQWTGISKIAWFQSEPVFNKVFEFVETMRGYLSDNKWGIDVVPSTIPKSVQDVQNQANIRGISEVTQGVEQTISANIEKVDQLLDFLWMDNQMQNKLAQVLQYVFLYGTGILKSAFDPENVSASGIGQIETTVLSPWYIFPDPAATCVQDASYIIEHHPVTMRWVLERYPDKYEEVKAGASDSTTEYSERRGETARGPIDKQLGKYVDVYEAWYTDATIVEGSDGNPSNAFPTGRMTLFVGDVVLEDKPNPYQQFPYVRFIEIPRPAEFFGDATVHKALGIQQVINQLLRAIIDNGLWLVHGIWITDSTSGVTPKTLSGYGPRDTIVKHPGTEVRRDVGEALPNTIFQTLEQQVKAFDQVVGLSDPLRGIVPSRQPVQTTMLQQEAGEVRTRERQRRTEESLEDLGKLWLDIVGEYWSDKRIIRNKKVLGGFEMFEFSKKDLAEWKYDIHVIPGSTTPMDVDGIIERIGKLKNELGVMIPDAYIIGLSRLPGIETAMAEAAKAQQEVPTGPEAPAPEPAPEAQQPQEAPASPTDELMAQQQMAQEAGQPQGMAVPGSMPSPEELAALTAGGMA